MKEFKKIIVTILIILAIILIVWACTLHPSIPFLVLCSPMIFLMVRGLYKAVSWFLFSE